jgi:hypothetical protein
MKPSQDNYPIFEANQVLTNSHLNQVFDYLDEQQRLTRANLIGIGIVCGLEFSLDLQAAAGATINLVKGCGVTSQGYLIVEPEDLALVAYRSYTPPTDPQYAPFLNNGTPFNLWELFAAGEPDTTPLGTPADFLADKALLLFLELKKEGLNNCSLNNCDDRGAQITITLRRLLIGIADLKTIMANANSLQSGISFVDLEAALVERLNLPDLRLPRVDVPNTAPATSNDLLAAFLAVFQSEQLAANLAAALTAAYEAFQPLLSQSYPTNPFSGFLQNFGFLDDVPATTTQVRFLQYYYDFFDDLIKGYDEFRQKGVDLLCLCCPPDGLFPRHLMLGVLFPEKVSNPGVYRQQFLASPSSNGCEGRTLELEQLFARLVEMTSRFTDSPPLTQQASAGRGQSPDIRITPSRLGDLPLSERAIPYYFLQNGTPALYRLWNSEKTQLNRANQNLSYRSDEYQPPAPTFVTNPLRYDLEPYNFLRVEGHLGKNYQTVMTTLLSLRSRYRLPIEILALQTGPFDENTPVDLSKEGCRFQDLEALYATLKAESICLWCNEVQYLYSLPYDVNSGITTPVKAKLPLLVLCAPDFLVQPRTLGRVFEDYLASQPGGVIPDFDPNIIINFLNSLNLGQSNIVLFYILIYISKLFEQMATDLQQFDFAAFQKRYLDLEKVTEAVEKEREQAVGAIEGNANLLSWEELDDRLEDLVYQCSLGTFKALADEYASRVREVKQQLFLSFFLQNNPGIQHKAGVPPGGTFVVVYHHEPAPVLTLPSGIGANLQQVSAGTRVAGVSGAQAGAAPVLEAFTRISANKELAVNPDIRLLLGAFTGKAPDLTVNLPPKSEADGIISQAVNELAEGTVIADFYLPYICCSDCSPIQFVLPKAPPAFSLQIGCSNANNQAEVTVTPEGGVAPYSVKVDDQDYAPIAGVLVLNAGAHTLTLRDQQGTESAPQTITIAKELTLGAVNFDCIGGNNDYVAGFQIDGGTPPYTANRGTVSQNNYSSDALPGDTDVEIVITDSAKCTASTTFRHSCTPALAFTAKLGCTSANNEAPVEIFATGGTAPYQVQVDAASPVPFSGPIQLSVGTHTLSVHDSASAVSATQTVVVPAFLTLTETDFTCEGTASYRSFIRIDGGLAPYVANGKPVTGNMFESDPIGSGAKLSLTVIDRNNCEAFIEVQHSCDQQCTLPCGGQSRRCAYRLWLQPPTQQAPYKLYQPDQNLTFRFNGKTIGLNTANIPPIQVTQLNGNFPDAMAQVVKALNDAVSQALIGALGASAANRLVLSYNPAQADTIGMLFIEYFVCDTFDLEFRYVFAMPDPVFTLTVRYSNEPSASGAPFNGMVVTNLRLDNKQTVVPAFDCSERNQCTGSDYQKLCGGPDPKPSIAVTSLGNNQFRFDGKVDNFAATDIAAWVWDFNDNPASEPFYQGQSIELPMTSTSGTVKLTVMTVEGCFASVQQKIVQ